MATELEDIVAEMTVERLARLGGRSVSEIAVYAWGGASAASAPARSAATSRSRVGASTGARVTADKGTAAKGASPNPRGNKYERAAAYTAKVRDVVRGASRPIAAPEIRRKVGGTAARLQLALKRLMAEGAVAHDGGATSSRRYSAA